jgi:hypothetical protein
VGSLRSVSFSPYSPPFFYFPAQATTPKSLSAIPSGGLMLTFEEKMPSKAVGTFKSPRHARLAHENRMIEQRINDIVWTDEAYRCVGANDAKPVVILACEAAQS